MTTGADERPKDPSISVWLGGADAPERMSLPSLPSLAPNAIVAQHFEQAPQGGGGPFLSSFLMFV